MKKKNYTGLTNLELQNNTTRFLDSKNNIISWSGNSKVLFWSFGLVDSGNTKTKFGSNNPDLWRNTNKFGIKKSIFI